MDQNNLEERTINRLVSGFPYAERLHSPSTAFHSIVPVKVPLNLPTTTERQFKQEVFLTGVLESKRSEHAKSVKNFKLEVQRLLLRIPYDMLAAQWLTDCTLDAEVRAYLVEFLLPQVVLGLEFVLKEADERELVDSCEMDPNFNPINTLAQFIMRNNPRFNNLLSLNPYSRGLNKALEALKEELFFSSDSELAHLKASAEQRRVIFEENKAMEAAEFAQKHRKVLPLFDLFLIDGEDSINAVVVQNAIRSFLEVVVKLPEELHELERPIVHVQPIEEIFENYLRSEFTTYVMEYAKRLPMNVFLEFTNHLQRCAREYKEHVNRRIKLDMMTKIFISCDLDSSGNLDKQNMFDAFAKFSQDSSEDFLKKIQSTQEWPIREYHLRHANFDPSDRSIMSLEARDTNNSAVILFDSKLSFNQANGDENNIENKINDANNNYHDAEPFDSENNVNHYHSQNNDLHMPKPKRDTEIMKHAPLWPKQNFTNNNNNLLTLKHFLSWTNIFLDESISISEVNHFANFIKQNYAATSQKNHNQDFKKTVKSDVETFRSKIDEVFNSLSKYGLDFIFLEELISIINNEYLQNCLLKAIKDYKTNIIANSTGNQFTHPTEEFSPETKFTQYSDLWKSLDSNLYCFMGTFIHKKHFFNIMDLFKIEIQTNQLNSDNQDFLGLLLHNLTSINCSKNFQNLSRSLWLQQFAKNIKKNDLKHGEIYEQIFSIFRKDESLSGNDQTIQMNVYTSTPNCADNNFCENILTCEVSFPESREYSKEDYIKIATKVLGTRKAMLKVNVINCSLSEIILGIPLFVEWGKSIKPITIRKIVHGSLDFLDFKFYLETINIVGNVINGTQPQSHWLNLLQSAFVFIRSHVELFRDVTYYFVGQNVSTELKHEPGLLPYIAPMLRMTKFNINLNTIHRPISNYPMTPNEYIFECVKTSKQSIKAWGDIKFINFPLLGTSNEIVGIVCLTVHNKGSLLHKNVNVFLNTVTEIQELISQLDKGANVASLSKNVYCKQNTADYLSLKIGKENKFYLLCQLIERNYYTETLNTLRFQLTTLNQKEILNHFDDHTLSIYAKNIIRNVTRIIDDKIEENVKQVVTDSWITAVIKFDPFKARIDFGKCLQTVKIGVLSEQNLPLILCLLNDWVQLCESIIKRNFKR